MSRALARLVAEHPGLLAADERIVVAGRGRIVAGTDTAQILPPSTIWAVSERRLFVFDAAVKRRRSLDAPIVAFDIAATVTGARIEPFDDREVLLVVVAAGHPAMVVMNPSEARGIVDIVRGIIGVASPSVAVETPPAPTRTAEVRTAPSPEAGHEPVPWVDPSDGDERIVRIRDAFASGDWELGRSLLAALDTVADREWVIRHLGGAEIAPGLDAWVDAEPSSAAAYLARGAGLVWTAFETRRVGGEAAFLEDLRVAELDLFWSVELDFADPVPFTPLVRSALGLGIPLEELCVRFDESVRRGGGLLGVHVETLVSLSPLGAGSRQEMLTFARTTTHDAPEGSPLHALVPLAHLIDFTTDGRLHRRTGSFSSEAIRDVELARMMSIDNAGWIFGPSMVEPVNIFAAAAVRCGESERARTDLATVGDTLTRVPWSLLADGEALVRAVGREMA